jgi:myosin heavy subunit
MSDLQLITETLERAAGRRRRERAFRGLCKGFFWGACVWVLAMAVYKLAPVPMWILSAAAGVWALFALAGLVIGGWRKISVNQAARWVDGKQHLQERLSTALELAKQGEGSAAEPWRELIVTDAASHAKEVDPKSLVQFRLPRATKWALLIVALGAGLGFVPEYRTKSHLQKQAEQKVIQEAGKQLVDLTKRSLQNRKPVMEATEKSMQAVEALGDQLTKQKLTRSEALKDLANMQDKLKEQLNEVGKDPAIKRMEQAARSPSGENSPEVARLQKQIADAQKQQGTPTGTPDQMDNMKKQMDKIQEAAKAANEKAGGMSAKDKDQLSQSMAALSKQAQEMGMQMPDIDQAIQALAANQTDMFMKDMEQATNDLEKARDMAKNMEQLQKQMEKMGKDLAEQLKNGQAEMAQSTLHKMESQLKAAKLTPEEMAKMMSDVSKAIDPGSKYGKVGDHLKEAAKQMQGGSKPGAAKELAEAAKELDKLMQQMNDAQSLSAELDALNKASMSVGTCQSWSQCQGNGNKPGMGKGGKPGSGVGTWADENSGWGYDGHQTQKWDNTGLTRADTTPRGQTDRGEGELSDALRPDKVKGQFSPGGQMPSITLKGVSIKGQSKVAYEEAAVAAQDDAQSALSQEKVPRAYQGAVRNYFDDLKK